MNGRDDPYIDRPSVRCIGKTQNILLLAYSNDPYSNFMEEREREVLGRGAGTLLSKQRIHDVVMTHSTGWMGDGFHDT